MIHFYEHIKRSLAKSITFRVAVIIADFIVVSAITHRYDIAVAVIVVTNIASTVLYYVHERIWNRITWGKEKK